MSNEPTTEELAELATRIAMEASAREQCAVHISRSMLVRAFEKALDELEACWVAEGMGSKLKRGRIEITLCDENGRLVACPPCFSSA